MITDIIADNLTSVKIQNINVPSASVAMDTAEQSLVSNQLILRNQKPVVTLPQSEGHNEKTPVLITHSTHADQEKPVLRRRKNNAVYYESSDSDEEDISNEGMELILIYLSKEERYGCLFSCYIESFSQDSLEMRAQKKLNVVGVLLFSAFPPSFFILLLKTWLWMPVLFRYS
jgi:hypothetical protein